MNGQTELQYIFWYVLPVNRRLQRRKQNNYLLSKPLSYFLMWKGVNGVNKQTLDKIEGENQEWIIQREWQHWAQDIQRRLFGKHKRSREGEYIWLKAEDNESNNKITLLSILVCKHKYIVKPLDVMCYLKT